MTPSLPVALPLSLSCSLSLAHSLSPKFFFYFFLLPTHISVSPFFFLALFPSPFFSSLVHYFLALHHLLKCPFFIPSSLCLLLLLPHTVPPLCWYSVWRSALCPWAEWPTVSFRSAAKTSGSNSLSGRGLGGLRSASEAQLKPAAQTALVGGLDL